MTEFTIICIIGIVMAIWVGILLVINYCLRKNQSLMKDDYQNKILLLHCLIKALDSHPDIKNDIIEKAESLIEENQHQS